LTRPRTGTGSEQSRGWCLLTGLQRSYTRRSRLCVNPTRAFNQRVLDMAPAMDARRTILGRGLIRRGVATRARRLLGHRRVNEGYRLKRPRYPKCFLIARWNPARMNPTAGIPGCSIFVNATIGSSRKLSGSFHALSNSAATSSGMFRQLEYEDRVALNHMRLDPHLNLIRVGVRPFGRERVSLLKFAL